MGCRGTSKVLGITREEAAEFLRKGDTEFIRQAELPVNFSQAESRLKQLSTIHSAAPFYAGLLIDDNKTLKALLFCAALESQSPPARREAVLELVPLILESTSEEEVKNILDFINSGTLRKKAESLITLRAACLYNLGRYDEVSKLGLPNSTSATITVASPSEVKLAEWDRALSLFATANPVNWSESPGSDENNPRNEISAFLFDTVSDEVWHWAYEETLSIACPLTEEELTFLSQKLLAGNYRIALNAMRKSLEDGGLIFFRHPFLIADLGRAYQYNTSIRDEGAALFGAWDKFLQTGEHFSPPPSLRKEETTTYRELEAFVETMDEEALRERKFLICFYAGRIERARTNYADSSEYFRLAQEIAPNDIQSDACLWYILMNAMDESTSAVIQQIFATMPLWSDVSYFSDILESVCYDLVAKRQWNGISAIFTALEALDTITRNTGGSSRTGIYAQYAWIIGRAVQEGYFRTSRSAESFFRAAFEAETVHFYYRALAASGLGLPLTIEEDTEDKKAADIVSPELEFILGFFECGASSFALPYIRAAEDDLSVPELRKIAEALLSHEMWKESHELISRYTSRRDYRLNIKDLLLFYPRPFLETVEKYSGEAELGPEMIFGLIRTESLFLSDVVSRSGAIGLTQLMKPTAEEMATRIARQGGPDYREALDLTDPEINIHIGSYYLRYLIGQMGSPMLALLSYNGGMGRMRRWLAADRRQDGGLPDDLFPETIEYNETREYGRRLVASAAVYGYLYYGKPMEELVADMFPATE